MEVVKGKTFKYLRDKREVTQEVKNNLKQYIKIKKAILDALREKDLTIEELTQKLDIPKHEIVYYLMSLVKYGFVQIGEIDDMDEYYYYKVKK
jgi:DNA-directed RNA polymerase specialized sigma subunit